LFQPNITARNSCYSCVFSETRLLVRDSSSGLMNSRREKEGNISARLVPFLPRALLASLSPVIPPRASPNLHSGFILLPVFRLPYHDSNLYWLLYRTTALLLRLYPTISSGRHPSADVTYHGRRRAGDAGRVAPLWRKGHFCRCAGGAPLPGFRQDKGKEWVTRISGVRLLGSWDAYCRHPVGTKYDCSILLLRVEERERERFARKMSKSWVEVERAVKSSVKCADHILTFRSTSHLVINVIPSTIITARGLAMQGNGLSFYFRAPQYGKYSRFKRECYLVIHFFSGIFHENGFLAFHRYYISRTV